MNLNAPREVFKVFKAAKDSAFRLEGVDLVIRDNAAHLSQEAGGEWCIGCNYETFSRLVLRYRQGQWFRDVLYSERDPVPVDKEKALTLASGMFN
jgi:hypothetical protein